MSNLFSRMGRPDRFEPESEDEYPRRTTWKVIFAPLFWAILAAIVAAVCYGGVFAFSFLLARFGAAALTVFTAAILSGVIAYILINRRKWAENGFTTMIVGKCSYRPVCLFVVIAAVSGAMWYEDAYQLISMTLCIGSLTIGFAWMWAVRWYNQSPQ